MPKASIGPHLTAAYPGLRPSRAAAFDAQVQFSDRPVHPRGGGLRMAGVTQAVGEALAPSTAVGGRALTLPRLWAFTSVALPVVASLEASMSSVDLAYQIRAGNLMLFTHHLLRHDTFTFTAAGRAWTDQQWGAQIAFALIWRAGGWAALALLRAALVGAI